MLRLSSTVLRFWTRLLPNAALCRRVRITLCLLLSNLFFVIYFSLAVTSMRAELLSGKVPTTLVFLLVSRLMRSIPLFVLIRPGALAPRA